MSLIGLATWVIGVLYAVTIIHSWYSGEMPFKGWAPLMMMLLWMGGGIMLMLGILGEYVWRIFDEVRKKPNYIVRHKNF